MSLTAALLRRPIGTFMACMGLAALGAFSLLSMPMNLQPRGQFPVLTVNTVLADTNAEEIELLITKKIEESLADIPGIRQVESVSRPAESQVTLQFHLGKDISEAALEVRSRIRRLWPSFPEDTRFPTITRYDPSNDPFAVLAVTSSDPHQDTYQWVYRTLKPQLSRISGVAAVRISGQPQPEIAVDCDRGRMKALGLTVHDVASAIKKAHSTMPAGFLNIDGRRLAVRSSGNLATPNDIELVPVGLAHGTNHVKVRDVAQVRLLHEESDEITRLDGRSLTTLAIYRSPDSDLKNLGKALTAKIMEFRSAAPKGLGLEVVLNQSEDLDKVLTRLVRLIPVMGLSTGAVLFIFLGNLSSTLAVMAAIPASLLVSVLLMRVLGISLDVLSLSALSLSMGILVDNAIVVIESIARRKSDGLTGEEAVVSGTQEVALPLFLSMVTTVIVFLPVAFVSREVRLFFLGFTWTVCLSLAASVLAGLVLVPVLYRFLGRFGHAGGFSFFPQARLTDCYRGILVWSGAHPVVVFAMAGSVLAMAGILSRDLSFRRGWIEADRTDYRVFMLMAPGTAKEVTDVEARKVEPKLLTIPGVRHVFSEVRLNRAMFLVSMSDARPAGSEADPADRLRSAMKSDKGIQSHVVPVGDGAEGSSITLNFQGPDAQVLTGLSEKAWKALEKIPGVRDTIVRQGNPVPVIEFVVHHDRLGFHGVQAKDLANHLRGHLTGPVATRIMGGERIIQVRVRTLRELREGLSPLASATVPTEREHVIPLLELVEAAPRMELGELHRLNRRPVVRLTLLLGKDDPLTVAERVQSVLDRLDMPQGYSYGFGEEIQDLVRTRKEMLSAAALGIALIYLLLVAATESFVQPLLIMVGIPFAAAGVVAAASLLHIPVSLPIYVGMIILCGLVINVNIVMAYAINGRLRSGEAFETAVIGGAQRRVRPILMTALTAVFGSLPMLLDRGAGSSIWSPFALTLAAGMASSTLFSLVLLPSLFTVVERVRHALCATPSGGQHVG